MIVSQKSYIGKGSIYIKEKGVDAARYPLGNCSALTLSFNEDKKEQMDYEGAGGGIVDSVSRIDSVTAEITALSLSANNIALALRGVINVNASESIVAEAHKAFQGGFLPTGKLLDSSQAVVVTGSGGTPTYVEDTDYSVKNSGLVVLDGAIADDTDIEVDYESLASYDVEGLSASGKEYEIIFDGLNEADSGKPFLVTMHRVKINPTQALSLISDEYAELPMTMDLLKDESITSANESPFVKLQMVQ